MTSEPERRVGPLTAAQITGEVLIVTAQQRLSERLQMIAAAAALSPVVVQPSRERDWLGQWGHARAVLIDVDCLEAVALEDPVRRTDVYVVAERSLPDRAWRMCVLIGAEDAVELDEAEGLLLDRLSLIDPVPSDGLIIGVVGACGGVGASTVASALTMAASRPDRGCMLIDADSRAGALDQILGCERDGLGWNELGSLRGRIDGEALGGAVSAMSDLPVLTYARDEPITAMPIEAVRSAAIAAASVLGTAVVDLGCPRDELLDLPDAVVVVSTSDIRGGLAVRRFAEQWVHDGRPVVVAARTPHRRCLPAGQFTDLASGLGPVYWCAETRGYAARLSRGRPVVRWRDRLVRDAAELLTLLTAGVVR